MLIDLSSNAATYRLTAPQDGVSFDLNATGSPRMVSWTRADSQVHFLVLDRNGNEVIDDGSELVGTATPTGGGNTGLNGFLVLASYDENNDGRIDVADPIFSSLQLWRDGNHNGQSDPSELQGLGAAGVMAFDTHYTESGRRDRYGNWYRYQSTAAVTSAHGRSRERRVFDVYLRME